MSSPSKIMLCSVIRCGRKLSSVAGAISHEKQTHGGAITCWPASWDATKQCYRYDRAYVLCAAHSAEYIAMEEWQEARLAAKRAATTAPALTTEKGS